MSHEETQPNPSENVSDALHQNSVNKPESGVVKSASPYPFTLLVAFIALGAAFLGSFLPWVRVLFVTVNGTDGDGNVTAILSLAAAGLLIVAVRTSQRQFLLSSLASACAAGTAGVFVYNLGRLGDFGSLSNDGSELFSASVTPQLGLVLGTFGAVVAMVCCLSLSIAGRRGGLIREQMSNWRWKDLAVLAAAAVAMTLTAMPNWWVATLIATLVSAALWFLWVPSPRFSSAIGKLALAGVVLAGVGTTVGAIHQSSSGDARSSECSKVFADGVKVDEVVDVNTCIVSGDQKFVLTMPLTCNDGTTLYGNSYGWGFKGGVWSTVGEAPADRCNSDATEKCSEIFKSGAKTQASWSSGLVDCFDESGGVTSVYTFSIDCYEGRVIRHFASNNLGWGYEGESWHTGSASRSC